MAAASATASLHSIAGINLKQHSNAADKPKAGENYGATSDRQPTSSSSSSQTSRNSSSGDGVNDSSSIGSETSSQNSESGDKGNSPAMIDGFIEVSGKESDVNDTAALSDVTCCNLCNSSRSDAVARCFECASYIPTHQRSAPCCGYGVGNASCLPVSFVLPSEPHGLEAVSCGSGMGGDCSRAGAGAAAGLGGIVGRCSSQYLLSGGGGAGGVFDHLWPERLHSASLSSSPTPPYGGGIGVNPYDIWGTGAASAFPNSTRLLNTLVAQAGSNGAVSAASDSLLDLRSKLLHGAVNAQKSPIKRLVMIYHCKFGEFGVAEGQFTEPSGVAVNAQNYIIVADTNNHRIQIFDKEGRYKFQFGECGKRDSQLLYPNRVAVSSTTGDIIVTERSPTHQVQIYNQYGQFVRKFGANILQHPRGLTVDSHGRIVVVECKVMRVIIFDQNGNVLSKFGCSKHLRFPNGVVVNDKEEIFISDNRAHCVKVFNYEGRYLRQIGGEGLTNYPIGVCINAKGEILIADNHNNFNLTIFTQDGQLIAAHESRVKHAQCFDVALIEDSSVVLASKDYRLYIYRYSPALPAVL